MESPPEVPQNGLAQPIAIPSRLGAMVVRPVALDPEKVTAWSGGVHYGQINTVPGTAHLRVDFVPALHERVVCQGVGGTSAFSTSTGEWRWLLEPVP